MNHDWVLANLAYLGYIQGEEENQLTAVRGFHAFNFNAIVEREATVTLSHVYTIPLICKDLSIN